MSVRHWLRQHWWLIVWGLIALLLLAPAEFMAEFMPDGPAGSVWVETIHRVEVEGPEPRHVMPRG